MTELTITQTEPKLKITESSTPSLVISQSEPKLEISENNSHPSIDPRLGNVIAGIKTAIELKKGSPILGDDNTYDDEIAALKTKEKYGSYKWYKSQRNPKWVDIDHLISEADRATGGKIVLLFPVHKTGAYIRFRSTDNPRVDYGDGTIVTSNNGSTYYEHHFAFENAPASSLQDDGSRQVIVVITPQAKNLTYFIPYNDGNRFSSSAIEAIAIGTDIKFLRFAYYVALELFRLIGESKNTEDFKLPMLTKYLEHTLGARTSYNGFFVSMVFDPKITLDISNVVETSYLFYSSVSNLNITLSGTPKNNFRGVYMYGNMKYGEIKPLDYSKCTSFYLFAYASINLTTMPFLDMINSENNTRAFENCYSLASINIANCNSSISFKYTKRLSLHEIVRFAVNGIIDMTGKATQDINLYSSRSSKELADLGTAGTVEYDGVTYTQASIIQIFTDKNWTITR